VGLEVPEQGRVGTIQFESVRNELSEQITDGHGEESYFYFISVSLLNKDDSRRLQDNRYLVACRDGVQGGGAGRTETLVVIWGARRCLTSVCVGKFVGARKWGI